jgi:molybdenum cofactor cytidylyltransferase
LEAREDSRVGAVVLAAGTSSRMGEVKQLLRFGERMLLEQVLDNVRGSRVNEVVLVLGYAAEAIMECVPRKNVKIVINNDYPEGMGTSLRAGLSALSPQIDAALIVLADQPMVRPATLNLLMHQYRESKGQIIVPMYKGFRGNPVLLDRSVFSEVMALRGDVGCRAIFGNHLDGIVKVPVMDVGVLLDLDSQADIERLKRFSQGAISEKALIDGVDLEGREATESPTAEPLSAEPHRVEPHDPSLPEEVIIVGAEPIGIALARAAKMLGFAVTVVDPFFRASDLPEADTVLNSLDFSHLPPSRSRYVVVASRGRFDEEAVEQALLASSTYVALVANKESADEIRRGLELRGEAPENVMKIRAPAALDIGSTKPEEIALNIMAEIVFYSRQKAANTSAASV